MSIYRRQKGHPPRRASHMMRVSALLAIIQTVIRHRGRELFLRFRGPHDWKRVVVLGVILVDLSILAMATVLYGSGKTSYRPGLALIFGGLFLSIVVIKMAGPRLYLDWLTIGALRIALGVLLAKDPFLQTVSSFALFCTLLMAAALLMTWIGATHIMGKGREWLMASGLTSACFVFLIFIVRYIRLSIVPDIVLATDQLLFGVSLIGFGLSLRDHRQQN